MQADAIFLTPEKITPSDRQIAIKATLNIVRAFSNEWGWHLGGNKNRETL
jgi:hypothetical protein